MKGNTPQRDLPQKSKCIKRLLLHIGLVRLFAFGFGVSKCALPRTDPPPPPQHHLHFLADSLAVMWGTDLQSPRCGGILGEGLSGHLSLRCHDTWWLLSAQSEVRRREGAVPLIGLSHRGWLWLLLPSSRACLTGEMRSRDYRSLLLNARLKKRKVIMKKERWGEVPTARSLDEWGLYLETELKTPIKYVN